MTVVEYGQQNPDTVMLLHGGGLSWWNYRQAAQELAEQYHVVLPVLDGHADSDAPFTTIEENAARLISYIDNRFDGQLLALGGLSLGGQIAAEMLSQRQDICRYALLESTLTKPAKLTAALIGPTFGMSYGLIKQKWFAKLQSDYLYCNVHLYIHVPRHGLKLGLIALQGLFCKSFGLFGNDEVGKGFLDGCAHY